jgi:hypothetical protein
MTDKYIRACLGHGRGNRRVRIHRNGDVTYYGSTDHYDRTHDYWHWAGYRADVERDITIGDAA